MVNFPAQAIAAVIWMDHDHLGLGQRDKHKLVKGENGFMELEIERIGLILFTTNRILIIHQFIVFHRNDLTL